MSEMVERVARAIEEAFLEQRVSAKVWGGVPGIVSPIDMAKVARAAIVAMREPTEGMLEAGMIGSEGWDKDGGGHRAELLGAWRDMIDEALK